ncbi:hypothetical protein [Priestia megaterium]|uniref:hypothetical protein n=1 Tax=Priestia megaterium TaxID=1404 RepID=UPI0032421D3D
MGYFLLGGLIITLIIPVLIACFMHFNVFSHALGDANGWLGFWGGYLGALVGAATVYILTHQQLKTQRELHKETIEGQTQLHQENLIHQRQLQMESIEISADMSDQRQRGLIVANLRINKIDNLMSEIITLNGVVSDRFNALRKYAEYTDWRKQLIKKIQREIKRKKSINKYQSIFRNGQIKLESRHTIRKLIISTRRLRKVQYNQLKLDKMKEEIYKYREKINELLEEETLLRNKIALMSATIKSESIVANLEDELDFFRKVQTDNLNNFHALLTENQNLKPDERKGKAEVLPLIDKAQVKSLSLVNQALAICREKREKEIFLFTTKNGKTI